ncbi:MAG: universal stress protein [Halioglobus sp.]
MTNYKSVLVAVDLDGSPEQVIARAKALVSADTKIHLLTVPFDPTYFYTSYAGAGGFSQDASLPMEDQAAQASVEKLRSLINDSGLNEAKPIVQFGRAAPVIVEQAERLSVDLIVVGSHGRHGVRLLLGSTANAVLHHAKCDVLAVRLRED